MLCCFEIIHNNHYIIFLLQYNRSIQSYLLFLVLKRGYLNIRTLSGSWSILFSFISVLINCLLTRIPFWLFLFNLKKIFFDVLFMCWSWRRWWRKNCNLFVLLFIYCYFVIWILWYRASIHYIILKNLVIFFPHSNIGVDRNLTLIQAHKSCLDIFLLLES